MFEYGVKRFVSEQFGNSATIEALSIKAYKGAAKSQGYRLCCYADYDDGMLYHCSCFESYEAAYKELMTLSCGIWKEV